MKESTQELSIQYVHQLYTHLNDSLVHYVSNERLENPAFMAFIRKALHFFYHFFKLRTLLAFFQSLMPSPLFRRHRVSTMGAHYA